MKRSPMPRRRRALGRRTGLAPMSAKRIAESVDRDAVREAVFDRDGRCLLDHRRDHRCRGPLTFHHLRKSGQGGRYTVDNGVTLCAAGNTWVEDWPPAARMLGLVVGWDPVDEAMVDHDEAARRRRAHGLVPRTKRRTDGDV